MGYSEFTTYYNKVLSLDTKDFDNFITTLNKPLPSSFRILKHKKLIKTVINNIPENEFIKDVYNNEFRNPRHKQFIVNQTNVGFIQRQEVVSMLPVLLMGLEIGHSVLDMCAAPGSKTKQILEMCVGDYRHCENFNRVECNEDIKNHKANKKDANKHLIENNTFTNLRSPLIVANDCSSKRLNVLITETSKIRHPSFLVTKYDAAHLPIFKTDFDRVLCDVPCSGDGTIRKAPDLLSKWDLKNSLGLHKLQVNILRRATKFVNTD
ncbi:MAG: hypothetical protein ACRCZW_02565, partial [Lactobacillaceae bacterium]